MIRPGRAGPGSDMLGQWRGARASYSPHQAGLQGLRRMGWDPRVQLTVGVLGTAMHPPTLSSACCGVQGVVGWVPGCECIGPGLCQMGTQGIWGLQAPLDVRAIARLLGRRFIGSRVWKETHGDRPGASLGASTGPLVSVGSGVCWTVRGQEPRRCLPMSRHLQWPLLRQLRDPSPPPSLPPYPPPSPTSGSGVPLPHPGCGLGRDVVCESSRRGRWVTGVGGARHQISAL